MRRVGGERRRVRKSGGGAQFGRRQRAQFAAAAQFARRTRELLAQRARRPPRRALEAVQPGRRRHHAHAVAGELVAAEAVDAPHLERDARPAVDPLERVVHVERVRPHRRLRVVGVVAVRLSGRESLDDAEVGAGLERPFQEEVGEAGGLGEAVAAVDAADDVKLRHRRGCAEGSEELERRVWKRLAAVSGGRSKTLGAPKDCRSCDPSQPKKRLARRDGMKILRAFGTLSRAPRVTI